MSGLTHEAPVGATVEWYTPAWLFAALGLRFDLDPCAPPGGLPWIPADRFISLPADGLAADWHGRVWCNPPYGRGMDAWMARMASHRNGIALVFARTDTAWFHDSCATADAICFLRKRVRFCDASGVSSGGSPGCGSMLVAWGDDCTEALYLSGLGTILTVPA